MRTRRRSPLGWVAGAAVAVLVVVAGGWFSSEWVVQRFTSFDLTQVPVQAPAYRSSELGAAWSTYRGRGVSVRVPPAIVRRQKSASASTALIVTNRPQTLWISLSTRPAGRWTAWWYRMFLFARHHPLGLIGKAMIVPPLGTRAPRFVEQRLGPWQTYLYVAPRRVAADGFDGPHHLTALFVARRDGLLDLEEIRAILASVRVKRP